MQLAYSKQELKILDLVSRAAEEINCDAYVIGGFVRDKILKRPNVDIDIVCIGDGIKLAEKTASLISPSPNVNIFKTFGTAQLVYENYEIEFVGARKESYRSDSRKPIVKTGNLDDDLNRRDFRINTLAVKLLTSGPTEVLDKFDGLKDLENGIIRTPLQPDQTYSDDPLRMMRAIRFASQLGFIIEDESFNSIKKNAERLDIISQERITTELNKIILSKKPSVGFHLMRDSGILKKIFPKFLELQGVEKIDGKAHKDNYYHTLEVLDNISEHTEDLWLRWAAILHDIAKPDTKRFENVTGWTFHGHEWLGAKMVPKIFKKLKLPLNEKMRFVQKLVRLHLRPISLTKETITDSAVRRLLFDAGNDIDELMTLCRADITSKNPKKVKRYLENFERVEEKMLQVEEKDRIRNWEPPISGEVIMSTFNLKPSKIVGELKLAVREAILDGKIPNEYDEAYAFMIKEAEGKGLVAHKK